MNFPQTPLQQMIQLAQQAQQAQFQAQQQQAAALNLNMNPGAGVGGQAPNPFGQGLPFNNPNSAGAGGGGSGQSLQNQMQLILVKFFQLVQLVKLVYHGHEWRRRKHYHNNYVLELTRVPLTGPGQGSSPLRRSGGRIQPQPQGGQLSGGQQRRPGRNQGGNPDDPNMRRPGMRPIPSMSELRDPNSPYYNPDVEELPDGARIRKNIRFEFWVLCGNGKCLAERTVWLWTQGEPGIKCNRCKKGFQVMTCAVQEGE
ncbi:hypothetical protein DL95DRAFT_465429 [Leptodontidium sp. 2 PMI_412]|nr:hypothetical protein DL95DRAFT_465429 [Leptodontidium sp. 2 PMI_412]